MNPILIFLIYFMLAWFIIQIFYFLYELIQNDFLEDHLKEKLEK